MCFTSLVRMTMLLLSCT